MQIQNDITWMLSIWIMFNKFIPFIKNKEICGKKTHVNC